MAPTVVTRLPSGESIRYLARSVSSSLKTLSVRDASTTTTSLCSVFAFIITSRTTLHHGATRSLFDLPSQDTVATSGLSNHLQHLSLVKRQNAILAIPTTYAGLNDGPSPGAVVGIVLGSVAGFILCLYILLITVQFYGVRSSSTTIKEEVIVHRKSTSKSKSRSRSKSHHTEVIDEHVSEHISVVESPPPPPRSRRETIVEEEIVHEVEHESSLGPEEVIVMEEESSHVASEEIVEVIEEQSSIVSPEPPTPTPPAPSRKASSNRRSGYRVVDPAEFGGGERPMRRLSRRSGGS